MSNEFRTSHYQPRNVIRLLRKLGFKHKRDTRNNWDIFTSEQPVITELKRWSKPSERFSSVDFEAIAFTDPDTGRQMVMTWGILPHSATARYQLLNVQTFTSFWNEHKAR